MSGPGSTRLVAALVAAGIVPAMLNGCAGNPPRFSAGPVVTEVHDDADIAPPAKREFLRLGHHLQTFTSRQARLALDPVPPAPALDVNRLGEVPRSSWYDPRGPLSPERVGAGAGGDDPGPEGFTPWIITGLKVGGRNPGFVFKDSRGARYICKFDKVGEPVVATAAGVVANRLFWALGYNVPDDRVVYFDRDALQFAPGAAAEDGRPLVPADIDSLLASLPSHTADGRYRALVSRFLDGKPVGGFAYRGTRKDDPNDRIPHQNRRSLRALRVFGAWLNHVDLKIDNTLDLYTQEDGRHFLRHYLVDFDGCLGGYWAARRERRIGYAFDIDLREILTGLPTFGLIHRPYEDLPAPTHPLLGLFEAEHYDPAGWVANYPNDYVQSCTRADAFWAATLMGRLTDDDIRSAVGAGRLGDPEAEALLTRILVARRDKTLDWALCRVTPVLVTSDPEAAGDALRFPAEDACRAFGRPADWRYRVEILDRDGRRLAEPEASDIPAVNLPLETVGDRDYLVVRWRAEGSRGTLPPTEAHYLRQGSGWKLVGVLRDGE